MVKDFSRFGIAVWMSKLLLKIEYYSNEYEYYYFRLFQIFPRHREVSGLIMRSMRNWEIILHWHARANRWHNCSRGRCRRIWLAMPQWEEHPIPNVEYCSAPRWPLRHWRYLQRHAPRCSQSCCHSLLGIRPCKDQRILPYW